jgi:hypothetical protein
VWLNEGAATYYAAVYAAELGGPSLADQAHRRSAGSDEDSLVDHSQGEQQLRNLYGPPRRFRFDRRPVLAERLRSGHYHDQSPTC